MKFFLYILSAFCILLGFSELSTAWIIAEGLLQGQAETDKGRFLLKMGIRLFYGVGLGVLAWYLFKKASKGKQGATDST